MQARGVADAIPSCPQVKYCGVCGQKLVLTESKSAFDEELGELLYRLEPELRFERLQKDILRNQEVFVDNMDALIPLLKKKAFFIVVGIWEDWNFLTDLLRIKLQKKWRNSS